MDSCLKLRRKIKTAEKAAPSETLSFFVFLLHVALPDPPMDVRVDGGPQDGTLLVTWIPVPANQAAGGIGPGGNKQAPVTGYAVFADGKRVTDVDSPSSRSFFVLMMDWYHYYY